MQRVQLPYPVHDVCYLITVLLFVTTVCIQIITRLVHVKDKFICICQNVLHQSGCDRAFCSASNPQIPHNWHFSELLVSCCHRVFCSVSSSQIRDMIYVISELYYFLSLLFTVTLVRSLMTSRSSSQTRHILKDKLTYILMLPYFSTVFIVSSYNLSIY